MIAFIREHKDQRVTGPQGSLGLRWGVEPMCTVLIEHGIAIAPATFYEWVTRAARLAGWTGRGDEPVDVIGALQNAQVRFGVDVSRRVTRDSSEA